jgi:tRNA(Leu) C34 or U34 (ribose-2'-O)-methylase TrmL
MALFAEEQMNATDNTRSGNRGYACVGLDNAKSDINIGSALRACGVFGAAMLAVSGCRYHKAPTDTMRFHRHLPLLCVGNLRDVIPYDCVPVAVDLIEGATSLYEYEHPQRAFYIFGAEDQTLGDRVLSYCRDVIYIPTNGCLNLAACVNVVLYDRTMKDTTKQNKAVYKIVNEKGEPK